MIMLESRKKDLIGKPIDLPAPVDFSVLKEIIGFFGHEQKIELWAEPEVIRVRNRLLFSNQPALAVFPDWRARQGVGIALVQKVRKGIAQLWMYRCRDELFTRPSPYFTLLVDRNPEEDAETQQIARIINHSIQEYFDPQY